MRQVHVAGVATTRFGQHVQRSLGSLAGEVVEGALKDAGVTPDQVQAAVFANAAEGVLSGQEMIRGQVSLKGTGLEGIPIVNTENACASGGSALHLAWLMVASGQYGTVIAIGAEKLFHADKRRSFAAIASGTDLSLEPPEGEVAGSVMMGEYAAEARRYAGRYGDVTPAMAAVAVKNREFASLNPAAQFTVPVTPEEVLGSRLVAEPLRLLMCSPLTDGAAAVILTAARSAVAVAHTGMVSHSPRQDPVVVRAAHEAYEGTGLGPQDIDLFQLHDACAFAEITQYEQIGLAVDGEGGDYALRGETALHGKTPVNTDGGLLSRGHALGATGLAQVVETTVQLRGAAGARQVDGAQAGLAVNGGGWMGHDYAAAVATLLVRV